MKLAFYKMSGAGNDFVLLSGGNFSGPELKRLAVKLCARKTAIGADGLLYVARVSKTAAGLRYFNPDGSEAFCGNGSRCAAWWAYVSGLVRAKRFGLSTIRGVLTAEITGRETVKMSMPPVSAASLDHAGRYPAPVKILHFLNTGVPHAVVPLKDIGSVDVGRLGRLLRYNKAFGAAGANVDFVNVKGRAIHIRTYERGVEAETLACGTGVTAAAIALGIEKGLKSPVAVIARSGERFKVWFKAGPGNSADGIYIEGPAKIIFEGKIEV